MSKIEKKIQSKCTLSLGVTWPLPWNATTCSRIHAQWGKSAQASQFCILREFLSSKEKESQPTRSQPTMSWAFWKHSFWFPLPWEANCDCLLYCWPLHSSTHFFFPECAHFLCVIWMKNLLKVFATVFQVFSPF